MNELFMKYCEWMKYVDLFVQPVWKFFWEMGGFALLIATIASIVAAVALTAIEKQYAYHVENLDWGDSFMGLYVGMCKMLFLPMVAELSFLVSFSGSELDNFITMGFVRRNLYFTLSNIAEWKVYFPLLLIIIISIRVFFALIHNILRLDIVHMLRFLACMLAAVLTGMSFGRFIMWMTQTDNVLFMLISQIVIMVIAIVPALAIHFCLFGWLQDIFSPLILIMKRAWACGTLVLVDKDGNAVQDIFGRIYITNVLFMFTSMWDI